MPCKSQSSQKKPSKTAAQQQIPKRHGADSEESRQEGAREPTVKCAQQVAWSVPGAGGREPLRPSPVRPGARGLGRSPPKVDVQAVGPLLWARRTPAPWGGARPWSQLPDKRRPILRRVEARGCPSWVSRVSSRQQGPRAASKSRVITAPSQQNPNPVQRSLCWRKWPGSTTQRWP